MGVKLRVMTDEQRPFMIFDESIDKMIHASKPEHHLIQIDESQTSGLIRQLFYHIMKREMNFSSETYVRKDRVWGAPIENGSWNGMVTES